MFRAQRQRRVDAGVAVAAGRIGLHRGRHQLEHVAQVLDHPLRLRIRGVGAQEPVRALQRLRRALEPLAHQGCRHQPVGRRPADLEALRPGAVHQELQAAGGLAQRGAERPGDARRVQPEHPSGGGGGAERAAGGGGMEPAVVMRPRRQRERHPACHLIARDDRRQHVGAGGAHHLARRQRRRDHRRAGMQAAGGVGVVEIERMGQRPVQERRPRRGVARRIAEHAGIAAGEAQRPGGAQEGLRALRIVPGADDVADQVQQQEARAVGHLRRQAVQADGGDEFGQCGGDPHGPGLLRCDRRGHWGANRDRRKPQRATNTCPVA